MVSIFLPFFFFLGGGGGFDEFCTSVNVNKFAAKYMNYSYAQIFNFTEFFNVCDINSFIPRSMYG